MGCDIHICAEKKVGGSWKLLPNQDWGLENRCYGTFGFLADVRNYSAVVPIAAPRGLPTDASESTTQAHDRWNVDAHSESWLSMEELKRFDYDHPTEDRRCTRDGNGGSTCDPGEGAAMTYREFLGPWFFLALNQLTDAGAERIVFWFDN